MRWANLDVERESDPRWLLVPAALRAHHHALIIACSREENGGIIRDCKDRSDRWWWAMAGFLRRTLPKLVEKGLAEWVDEGRSLRVSFYDTTHELIAIASRQHARNMAKARWDAYAARIAASNAAGNARGSAAGNAAGSAPGPDPGPDPRRDQRSPLPPTGGEGQRAPDGVDEAGPDGFERWWATYPKTRPGWKSRVMERWIAEDLEPEADEIIAYCAHQATTRQWRQRGPLGPQQYVPTPWRLLMRGAWRKRGAWNRGTSGADAPPVASAPAKRAARGPEVVDAGQLVDATVAHRHLMEFLADVDVSEDRKEKERRRWIDAHPGQVPPWAQQPARNGRAAA